MEIRILPLILLQRRKTEYFTKPEEKFDKNRKEQNKRVHSFLNFVSFVCPSHSDMCATT